MQGYRDWVVQMVEDGTFGYHQAVVRWTGQYDFTDADNVQETYRKLDKAGTEWIREHTTGEIFSILRYYHNKQEGLMIEYTIVPANMKQPVEWTL